MSILTDGFRPMLLELLADGMLDTYHAQVVMPFRFNTKEMEFWLAFARPETHVYYSQLGDYLDQGLGIASYHIRNNSDSEAELINVAAILQNSAWHRWSDLGRVVSLSGMVLEGEYPLLAKEHAADALKNAAYYPGPHIDYDITHALRHGYIASPRIRTACVRTMLYASGHSKNLLQKDEVRGFLEIMSRDKIPFTSENAREAYAAIFGR